MMTRRVAWTQARGQLRSVLRSLRIAALATRPAGAPERAPVGHARSDGSRQQMRLCPTPDPACHEHDNQHQENDPAKTTANERATQVETAPAEQQQQDNQQNEYVHDAFSRIW